MKLARLMPQLGMGFSTFCCLISSTQAGIPVWSFTPNINHPPTATVAPTGSVAVQYTVSNNSRSSHNLVILPQTGVSQNGPCVLGPKGTTTSTCLLSLTISGSALPASGLFGGPTLCQVNPDGAPNPNECYHPRKEDSLAITVMANLALSVKGLTLNGQSSGQSRVITVTNRGDTPTTGLSISYPTWPTGTTVDTTSPSACANGTILPVGGSCTITVVPGTIATSGAGNAPCTTGIAPIPGVVTVTANGVILSSTTVEVLGYGCIYQGGYIYAMTETANPSASISGTVTSLSDQAPRYPNGIDWTSNGGIGHGIPPFDPTDVSYDLIPGVDAASTPSAPSPTFSAFQAFFASTYTNPDPFTSSSFSACQGLTDGQCNTRNLVTFYNQFMTNNTLGNGGTAPFTASPGPTPLSYYAAGLCKQTISGYSDWYLPAICEMGPANNGSGCVAGTQNIIDNLPDLIGIIGPSPDTSCAWGANCLTDRYWSSTEDALFQRDNAWSEIFDSGSNIQSTGVKYFMCGVRCSRSF